MSFREKSAWITVATVLLCFGAYFGAIATGQVSGYGVATLRLLLICVIGLVGLQVGLTTLVAIAAPKEAQAPADEREKLIQGRANTVGYYVLLTLVLTLGVPIHLGHSPADLANFALLDVVLSTLAVAAAQIVMFRRDA